MIFESMGSRQVRRWFGSIAVIMIAAICTSARSADGLREISYRKLYADVSAKKAEPFAGVLRVLICLSPEGGQRFPEPLKLAVRDANQITPLPLDADRCFELPHRDDWIAHDAQISVNWPDRLKFTARLAGMTPASLTMTYEELMSSVLAFRKLIASEGMFARMMVSSKGVDVRFPRNGNGKVVIHETGGDITFSADAEGIVHLSYDEQKNADRVDFSEIPISIRPDGQ